jgi:hypothetical protein
MSLRKGSSIERQPVVLAVKDSWDREAGVAQVEALGAVAVTPSELEAMQQEIAETTLVPQQTMVIKPRGYSRHATIAMLTALAGAASVGHHPRTSSDRRAAVRSYDGSGKAQAEKIAAAKAKRERKAEARSKALRPLPQKSGGLK